MSHVQWSEERAIHLPEVDAEHRGLYLAAKDLRKALAGSASAQSVDQKMRALIAEAEDHFTHEERLMRDAGYEMYDWHKQQHDHMRRRARSFARRLHKGDRAAGLELVDFLTHWLEDHMAVADNMMAAAVRNHQRSGAA